MQTVTLSESAVATLRFLVKGWHFPIREQDLPAYRELVDAGIMEPDGDAFRFTAGGREHREAILEREADRIERERFEPPDAGNLSDSARALLRRIASGERVEITTENRPAFRELAAARIIYLMHTFAKGDDSGYRFTYLGWERRLELAGA